MATNSSTTTSRRRTDGDTTTSDRPTSDQTDDTGETTETVGVTPAMSYAGDGNTRGTELDPTTHGAHRRNNPADA